jgi:L-alanine-DL-glutamate epimerase-like enolase superfamily enzyme
MRDALGPETKICVDANQGYPTPKVAVQVTKAMAEYDLLYMEQPVEGIDQMAEVAKRVDTPIMADESAWTAQDVMEIVQKKAADMISIYTTKPGGLFKAKKVAAVAEAAGLKCNVNGSVETGVGNAANIHLAASTEVVTFGCVVPVSTPKARAKRESPAFTTRTISLRKGLALAMAIFWFRQTRPRHRVGRRQTEALSPRFVDLSSHVHTKDCISAPGMGMRRGSGPHPSRV